MVRSQILGVPFTIGNLLEYICSFLISKTIKITLAFFKYINIVKFRILYSNSTCNVTSTDFKFRLINHFEHFSLKGDLPGWLETEIDTVSEIAHLNGWNFLISQTRLYQFFFFFINIPLTRKSERQKSKQNHSGPSEVRCYHAVEVFLS